MANNLEGDHNPRETDKKRERRTALFQRKLLSQRPKVGMPEEHATIVTRLEAKGKGKGVASPIERANSVAGEASDVTNTQDQSTIEARQKLLEIQKKDISKNLDKPAHHSHKWPVRF